MAATVSKVNGVAAASIAKINGVASASIAAINGVTWDSSGGDFYNGVIDYSCMFDEASTTKTQATMGAADSQKIMSFSFWFKKTKNTDASTNTMLYVGDSSFTGNMVLVWWKASSDQLDIYLVNSGADQLLTTQVLRDCSGWYHVVGGIDTTQGTAADRFKLYLNGSQVTDFATEEYWAQNADIQCTTDDVIAVGGTAATGYFDGYISDFHWIDGTQYAASDFGETSNGIWIPKTFSGNYGSNGVHLTFEDNTSFGDDTSGNTNDLTDTNLGTDHQVTDTPENNHCTLDPSASASGVTLAEGGLAWKWSSASYVTGTGSFLLKSGKWYFEWDSGADNNVGYFGIMAAGEHIGDAITTAVAISSLAQGYCLEHFAGGGNVEVYNNSSGTTTDLGAPSGNEVLMCAVDCDNNKIWFGRDGVWADVGGAGTGVPANGTNPAYTPDFDLYDFIPALSVYNHSTGIFNFGQRTFTHAPPTGFKALNTENLPAPELDDPSDGAFNSVIYEGTGAENAITGVGFQPDIVIIKNRDQADPPHVYDTTQGATYWWEPNVAQVQQNDAQSLKSFDADGFTLGTNVEVNTNTENYIAHCWKESANYGVDILTYEGTGAAHTESHNLGVAPELIIVHDQDSAIGGRVYHWAARNKTDPETDYAPLDTTGAWTDNATLWNDTAPTTTVFTVGTANGSNKNGKTYMAYLFASIEGLSKCFWYDGNNNANGPYVYCGFRPAYIMLRISDGGGTGSWYVTDSARFPTNGIMGRYSLDDKAAETADNDFLEIYANGFKLKSATGNTNNYGYAGIAFAEQPFKYANAR